MDIALLESTMSDRGEPAYRTRQVWEWAARGAEGYDAMTNVPAGLRDGARGQRPVLDPHRDGEQQARDGTVKTLFRTARRPPRRGGADALPRRAALDLRLVAVRLPAHVHLLRHRRDAVRPQPDAFGDPRPGAPLPAPRARSTTASSWAWASRS